MQLLPKDVRERRSPSDSSVSLTSTSLVAYIFAKSYSPMSLKEKLCQHSKHPPVVHQSFCKKGCRQTPRAVRLRSPRLSVQRSLGLSERKKRLFRALSPGAAFRLLRNAASAERRPGAALTFGQLRNFDFDISCRLHLREKLFPYVS
ncbi:unnamed protein product [Coccothraustes coccothraustes]